MSLCRLCYCVRRGSVKVTLVSHVIGKDDCRLAPVENSSATHEVEMKVALERNSYPIIFALPGEDEFALRLSLAVGGEMGRMVAHTFPDGETLVRLESDVNARCVIFAGSLDHPNDKTIQLLFAADAARDLGASKVVLVAPYLGYMRQDARFRPGEAITSRTYAAMLSPFFDALITVDPHLHRISTLGEIYSMPAFVVSSAPLIAAWVHEHVPAPLLVGPDSESAQWVNAIAAAADVPCTVLMKTRRGDRDVSVSLPDAAQWQGRNPVLIDDIISTGHTLMQAAASLRIAGLAPAVCIGVHALFAEGAYAQLLASGVARVVTCDTIKHPSNAISVLGPLAAALRGVVNAPIHAPSTQHDGG
jgi:ribose-phosphate pyrophosphokinase